MDFNGVNREMPDSMDVFFGCEGSGDIRQRNETRGKRTVAISPKLANGLSSSLARGHNGNDLGVKLLNAADFKVQESCVEFPLFQPNAGAHLPPEAEARNERRL